MMPNMDPRQLKRMMDSMGMKNTDIEAIQVIIKCPDKDIVIDGPSVSLVEMQGNKTYSVTGGTISETETAKVEIDEADVQMVASKTGASDNDARKALEESNGNMADAILKLTHG